MHGYGACARNGGRSAACFHVVGPELSIPEGSDTDIVKKGLIQYQTVHDVIVPTEPPAM
jgi:hypothetical protein